MASVDKSVVYTKAYAFSVRIVKVWQHVCEKRKEYVLSKQPIRCATSIGANMAEANGAISDADFSSKISLSYKESLETKYWLSLMKDTGYLSEKAFTSLHTDADELSKMLYAILKKTRLSKTDHC
ncbi:MAG: four helix bundle protein [Phycisphaerae bacterium]|nr:four helix bundle protein [Phycisphaerae bacterium]